MEASETKVEVLFVDDEENILKSLRRLVMDEPYEVHCAASGARALEILTERPEIGIIVSDQRMPGMTGVELLARSHAVIPNARRVLLTGYADITATIAAINKGGAHRYVAKPWDDQDLLGVLRDEARQYLLVEENRRLSRIVAEQNEELKQWNANLKERVLDQTAVIRRRSEEIAASNTRLRKSYDDMIAAFSGLVELLSPSLRNHSRNVAALSEAIAREVGMTAVEIETVRVAALLHDIGKIGIPEAILLKRSLSLDAKEYEEYNRHSVRGQTAVDAVEDLREAGILIRHHHEHLDGSGFPDGLVGEAIPLGARIIAITDMFDRIIEHHVGETALDIAFLKLEPAIGLRYDPKFFSHLKKHARYVYFSRCEGGITVEDEVAPGNLLEGMILAQDVVSGTGLMLLAAGVVLDESKIEALKRYYRLDPPSSGVRVLVKK